MAKKRKVQKMVLMGNKGNGRTYSNKHKIPEDFGSGKSEKIKKSDLKGYSLEEMITMTYGKKGTKKRKEADERINKKSKGLVKNNKLKEKSEGINHLTIDGKKPSNSKFNIKNIEIKKKCVKVKK